MEEILPKVIKKTKLDYRDASNGNAIFGPSSLCCFCSKERNSKSQGCNFFLKSSGCLNRMRRYAGKGVEYQQESYAEFLKRKTKGMFSYTRIVKVVLKKSEYDWDGLYLYSSKKNQR